MELVFVIKRLSREAIVIRTSVSLSDDGYGFRYVHPGMWKREIIARSGSKSTPKPSRFRGKNDRKRRGSTRSLSEAMTNLALLHPCFRRCSNFSDTDNYTRYQSLTLFYTWGQYDPLTVFNYFYGSQMAINFLGKSLGTVLKKKWDAYPHVLM